MSVVSAAASASESSLQSPAPSTDSTRLRAEASSVDQTWEDFLLWYILWLYQRLGGNLDDMQNVPTVECMARLVEYYRKIGIPAGLSGPEQEEFQDMIESTRFHLADAPPDYYPSGVSEFASTLGEMYQDVGGDPDILP